MSAPSRRRLSADDRRRQLLGIGLSKLVEKPIQDLSMDEVAAEAGISRGLLFHYFPTKTDFYVECMAAAGRRLLRNTRPDETLPGPEQVEAMVGMLVERISRRRDFYLSLIQPGHDPRIADVYQNVRAVLTDRVVEALSLDGRSRAVVHAWWAYVEDRALAWSAVPAADRRPAYDALVSHCCSALQSLLVLA